MSKAIIVPADINENIRHIEVNGLGDLQEAVRGYIQFLPYDDRHHAYVNEEGKLNGLEFNKRANVLLHEINPIGLMNTDYIVGNLLIVGETPDGEEADVEDGLLERVIDSLNVIETLNG